MAIKTMGFQQRLQRLRQNYLLRIPEDTITGSAETWIEVPELLNEDDLLQGVIGGVADVQSGSEATALDGTLYNTW